MSPFEERKRESRELAMGMMILKIGLVSESQKKVDAQRPIKNRLYLQFVNNGQNSAHWVGPTGWATSVFLLESMREKMRKCAQMPK